MARTKSNGLGIAGTIGAIAVIALGGAVACGDDFSADDCKVSRTCMPPAGASSGGAPGDSEPGDPSDTGQGGDSSGAPGGAAADAPAAEGGAGGELAGGAGAMTASNDPPAVITVSPTAEQADVEPTTAIVITFSEPLAAASVTADSIKLLDRNTAVPGKLTYADSKVTFTPDAPLALLAGYEIEVNASLTDVEGLGLPEAFSSSFSVRDGVWRAVNAATGTFERIADMLPMAPNGDALVAWNAVSSPGNYCPPSARWFNRGAGLTKVATKFAAEDMQNCRFTTAGGNAAGIAAVVWQEDAGSYSQQYRAGAWQPASVKVSEMLYPWLFSVGVSPLGTVTLFEGSHTDMMVSRSDAMGTWIAKNEVLSSEQALSPARIAFDADGNGLAAWRVRDDTEHEKIVVSRYTTAAGKWLVATDLPGSTALNTGMNHERGVPALAFDADGGALALWVKELGGNGSLMASRFTSDNGWADPISISGTQAVNNVTDPPALAFDGQTFVAAWTGKVGQDVIVYSARFSRETGVFAVAEPRTPAATNLERMPQLGADPRQNLLLVWAKAHASGAALVYERYQAATGTWSDATAVAGGTVKDPAFATTGAMPLGTNDAGLGALMWLDKNAQQVPSVVRLASFY